jgi:adenylate kinase
MQSILRERLTSSNKIGEQFASALGNQECFPTSQSYERCNELNLILFGPPGSGKGTYASKLEDRLELSHISTGDLVREEIRNGTALGKKIEQYSNSGLLVPDDLIIEILKKRLSKGVSKGFVLEGFPRTLAQAEALEKMAKIDFFVNIDVPDDIIIERLSSRLQCSKCGAIYNEKTLKPKVAGICDLCGGSLYRREDDEPHVIRERLRIYKEQSKPVIEYYSKRNIVKTIRNQNPNASPDEIVEKILSLIRS